MVGYTGRSRGLTSFVTASRLGPVVGMP